MKGVELVLMASKKHRKFLVGSAKRFNSVLHMRRGRRERAVAPVDQHGEVGDDANDDSAHWAAIEACVAEAVEPVASDVLDLD